MSDRIAVFNEGRIEQVSPPFELYEQPSTEFVAGFVGVSNILERDGERFTIRPEKIQLLEPGSRGGRPADRAGADRRDRLRRDGHPLHRRARRRRRASTCATERRRGRRRTRPPSRARRSRWDGVRSTRSPFGGKQRRRRSQVRTRSANPHRTAWVIIAGLLAFMLLLAGCGSRVSSGSGGGGEELQKLGKGEGEVDLISWAGLRRTGMEQAVRRKDRLQGQRQGRRDLRRNGEPDAHRRIRRCLRIGQRHRAAVRRRRRGTGQHRPRPQLQDGLLGPQGPAVQHVRRPAVRDPARSRRQPADVEQQRSEAGAEIVEHHDGSRKKRPSTRARSASTTIRCRSPKRRSI